jgi:DNA-binding response OmpR family regulator
MNRILILDDEESIQILYADELAEEGYEVITSGDGSRIPELIEKERPDLIILDIKLGEYNGTYYNLPVILCTAYPNFKYYLKSIAADYYVVKSSSLRELKLKIKMALEGGRHFMAGTRFEEVGQIANHY